MVCCVSVIIPIAGDKSIPDTIRSIALQEYEACEVFIVRNGQAVYKPEEDYFDKSKFHNLSVEQIGIPDKGKAKALNAGLESAKFDIVAVIDADCIVEEGAFYKEDL